VTRAYLNDRLVQTLRESGAPDLAAVAGVDEKAKDLIVKVVNGADVARTMRLDVGGAILKGTGAALVLSGPDLLAENGFDTPNRIAPLKATISGLRPNSSYTFPPRSVTILRLALRG
jgi:alpha-L-arabinofuranosidase